MASGLVGKFLDSTIRELITSKVITKIQAAYLSHNILRKLGWYNGYDGLTSTADHYCVANKKDAAEIKSRALDSTISYWLETENFETSYRGSGDSKYRTNVTDAVGKIFLENGFGYLCWWRIRKSHRKGMFSEAVVDMGKDFVLSLPIEALPISKPEELQIWGAINGWEEDKQYGHIKIKDIVNLDFGFGSTFISSVRILQEAGFTKKDGSIFNLDLKIESEADKLRMKYPNLRYREAKIVLGIAKAEGWMK